MASTLSTNTALVNLNYNVRSENCIQRMKSESHLSESCRMQFETTYTTTVVEKALKKVRSRDWFMPSVGCCFSAKSDATQNWCQ
jgi:hypothetical protein